MSDIPRRISEDDVRRYVGLGIIWGAAALMALVELRHIQEMETTTGIAVFALLPFLLNVGIVGCGVVLWRTAVDGDTVLRIAGWMVVGMMALALVGIWDIAHQNIRGRPFAHAPFVTVSNMSAGAMVGILLGWYHAKSRRLHELEEERAKLAFLHRTLRHNLLNGLGVMLGNTELVRDEVDESLHRYLDRIRCRGDELVRFVDAISVFRAAPLGSNGADFHRTDLPDVLATEVEAAREDFERADFRLSISDDTPVMADELLPELFNNLLSNAVRHNDNGAPDVVVSAGARGDDVLVSIADNGPGIPDDEKDRMTEWDTKGRGSDGTGLGLAIADTLATRYGGRLWIEDNEPTGTTVNVALPKATDGEGYWHAR